MIAATRVVAAFALAAIGCATPDVVACADGRICPVGTLCVASGCALPGCGDGDVDVFFGEQCDDGNVIGGDGCSAACRDELCGNGLVEPFGAEECDDGDLASHDGCSSGCLVEAPAWRVLPQTTGPGHRVGAAAAWDPDRGRAMIHGGRDPQATTSDEVWTFDGAWHREPAGPPPLDYHRMAWDGAGSIVLFGGATNRDDCWIWDGAWAACPGSRPPGRSDHGMATAPGGGILVFGGIGVGDLSRTWRWDRVSGWRDAEVASMPPILFAWMVHDEARGVAVLGGVATGGQNAQTWLLGASAWSSIGADLPRYQPSIIFDPDRGRVVAYGGQDPGGNYVEDARELDVDRWFPIPAGAGPPGRFSPLAFHDAIRRGVVLFGGSANVPDGRTWILRWESATPDEDCANATTDADADGLAGCDDPDCWGRCDPRCPPGVTCDPARPRCGDGTCNAWLETAALCPGDCP